MNQQDNINDLEIRRLCNLNEAKLCARLMADNEPWITLKRDYSSALKIISDTSREVYLALKKGEIVGFIVIILHGAIIGYIQSVCVANEWRNKGIGSRLMAYAEKHIFSRTPNVFICVSSFNSAARKLYERLGYQTIGELKDYIVSGHSEILLRKTIGPLSEFKEKELDHLLNAIEP